MAEGNMQNRQYGAAEVGALAHLYRGEMYRSTVWRTRLDTTNSIPRQQHGSQVQQSH
jgi:uncharacterized membrane protein